MSNNARANLVILVAFVSVFGVFFSLSMEAYAWFGISLGILLVAGIVLVMLHRQAKSQVNTCSTEVTATVKWWETGSGGDGITLMMVLLIPVNGVTVEKGYVQRGGLGVAELTQFLDKHPVGSAMLLKINPANLATIVVAENDLVLTDNGESLVMRRMNKQL